MLINCMKRKHRYTSFLGLFDFRWTVLGRGGTPKFIICFSGKVNIDKCPPRATENLHIKYTKDLSSKSKTATWIYGHSCDEFLKVFTANRIQHWFVTGEGYNNMLRDCVIWTSTTKMTSGEHFHIYTVYSLHQTMRQKFSDSLVIRFLFFFSIASLPRLS